MNKAEMQHHWDRYTGFVRDALAAEKASEFFTATQLSERSWAHLEGAIRHTRKSDVTISGLAGVEIVLSYAPLLFDAEALDRLGTWCSENRRILKASGYSFDSEIESARRVLWRVHGLWSELDQDTAQPVSALRRAYPGDDAEWERVLRIWSVQEAVRRVSIQGVPHLVLTTQMDSQRQGKCPTCGAIAKRLKAQLLEPTLCGKCKVSAVFVEVA